MEDQSKSGRDGVPSVGNSSDSTPKMINPEEEGRQKEWQDRGRVNLEKVPEGTKTNIERDFEPEKLSDDQTTGEKESPAY